MTPVEEFDADNAEGEAADDDLTEVGSDDDLDTEDEAPAADDDDEESTGAVPDDAA
jgi:hypothetical protein